MERDDHYDVVILGGGLAGLALARQLLLETDKTILLLERLTELPPARQKVGESSVQVGGYYYSRVLDLEEYLLREHYMKYNLRFYWRSPGLANTRFEDYSQGYIRNFSNVPSYQINRNTFEAELLRRNRESERFSIRLGVRNVDETLSENGPHSVRFVVGEQERPAEVQCHWLVDTTGRHRLLARRRQMRRQNEIRHGSFWWWVDGLVDVDRLSDRPHKELRKKTQRRAQGHLPSWLATNHFCDEGLWFWVIPLQGLTSLGLVYDRAVVDHDDVFSVEKATRWVCERFPCLARDLPDRKVLDFGGLKDYSHDCVQTLSASRWAIAGEAGRFTDPLYSPGSDLIAIYNTLIVDAIRSDPAELGAKCQLYEQLMRVVYQAYLPSYARAYDVLGDHETFCLKYTWELSIYFAFYVFPFINDLFTERHFLPGFFRNFARLGPLNEGLQSLLSGYYRWKKATGRPAGKQPVFFDFTEIATLRRAEKTFYQVGVSVSEAKDVLRQQLASIEELARFIVAHVSAVVVGDQRVTTNASFVAGIDIDAIDFDPDAMRARWQQCAGSGEVHKWTLDPTVLARFHAARADEPVGARQPA